VCLFPGCAEDPVDLGLEVGRSPLSSDMFTMSDSMQLVPADITRVMEVVNSHIPVPNTLGPRDDLGRLGLWFG
jgi:hypothetical protein